LALIRLRCRPCHTVETCFPPWLLPYEALTLDQLTTLLTDAGGAGQSWTQVARTVGCEPLTVRRRWRRWGPWGAWLRQQVAQHAAAWGLVLAWATWQPPPGTRSADWAWLPLAWAALALVLPSVWAPPWAVGLTPWQEWVPGGWPAAVVPARTHLGRRLRVGAGRPP
jgi:hypothetical protein